MPNQPLKQLESYIRVTSGSIGTPDDPRLYERYVVLKQRLLTQEQSYWASRFSEGNDHGPGHISRVLEYLGMIVGSRALKARTLTPYELFLSMVAVLYHDVGLLRGRKDHAASSAAILASERNDYLLNQFERDIVAAIVASHSSTTDIEQQCSRFSVEEYMGGQLVRPRTLAGLVRLADECDEDYRRADESVMVRMDVGSQSRPYWEICQRIKGIRPDPGAREIRVHLKFRPLDFDILSNHNGTARGEPVVVLVGNKLAKLNAERETVLRFLPEAIRYERVRVVAEPIIGAAGTKPRQFDVSERVSDFIGQFPEFVEKPAASALTSVLEDIRSFRLQQALRNLRALELIESYLPARLRLAVLYERACAESLTAQGPSSSSRAMERAAKAARKYLIQWLELGLSGAWREDGRTERNEIFRMSRDSDLWCVLSENHDEIRGLLPEDVRSALADEPPARRSGPNERSGCMPPGALVATPAGEVVIEELRPGESVL